MTILKLLQSDRTADFKIAETVFDATLGYFSEEKLVTTALTLMGMLIGGKCPMQKASVIKRMLDKIDIQLRQQKSCGNGYPLVSAN